LKKYGRCIVVVSEGFDVGELGEVKDNFGHTSFGSSKMSVAQIVTNYLNSLDLPVPGKARYQIPGTDQRDAMIYASTVDLEESFKVGFKCAQIAKEDGNGWMGTILREPGPIYNVRYDKAPLEKVANSERFFPQDWIAESRYDVTDDFIKYAQPLIGTDWPSIPLVGGLQRFARFEQIFADKKLGDYIPQGYRK
ncbi:MAG: 6-phosphofructokinase, partial [Candidatus Sumerlaeota bacterium]